LRNKTRLVAASAVAADTSPSGRLRVTVSITASVDSISYAVS
jgi:hypothetical protein